MMIFGTNLKKIGKWKDERNAEALMKAVANDDIEIKAAAIEALGAIQHRGALSHLLNGLRHPLSSAVRISAAQALGQLKAESAIEQLIKTLGDDNPQVRQAARQALESIGSKTYVPLRNQLSDFYHETIRKTCREILLKAGSRATDQLIDGLREGTYGIREESAAILGEIGDARGREALVEALGDKRIEVRRAAAAALTSIGWKPGRDAYAAHFHIANGQVENAVALGNVAIAPLVLWLQHDDMELRRRVAVGLRRLDWRPQTRTEAADFWAAAGKFSELVKLGPDAIDTLVRLLSDKNVRVKKGAAKVLSRVGVPAQVKQLVKDINQMADITIFKLDSGTFNLERIALEGASHYRNKYFLLKVDNCDEQQTAHIMTLYPQAQVISEDKARAL